MDRKRGRRKMKEKEKREKNYRRISKRRWR
jgi:hypothetical protein